MASESYQPRGQPSNRGQWRSKPHADDLPTSLRLEKSSAKVVVTGNDPYSLKITADGRDAFQGALAIIKSVKGRRFDGTSKLWTVPASSADDLAHALDLIRHEGWQVNGGPAPLPATASASRASHPAATARFDAPQNRIEFPLDYHQQSLREALKADLPVSWDAEAKVWHMSVPRSAAGWGRVQEVLSPLNVSLASELGTMQQNEQNRVAPNSERLSGVPLTLREYQTEGSEFILKHRHVLLADEPGLGKTIQSLAAVIADDAFPVVVVCPASLRTNWKKEAQRMCPDGTIQVIDPEPEGSPPSTADVVIVSYNSLAVRAHWLPPEPKSVIYDEMHYLQNTKANRTQAVAALSESLSEDALLVGLSGTPMRNRPANLLPFLEMSGTVEHFGGVGRFLYRYCDPKDVWSKHKKATVTTFAGASNLSELHHLLEDGVMIRRRKSEVLKDLPAKTTVLTPVDLTDAMARLYHECELAVAESITATHMESLLHLAEGSNEEEEDADDIEEDETLTEDEKQELREMRKEMTAALDDMVNEGLTDEIERRVRQSSKKVLSDSPVGQISFLRRLASVAKMPEVINRIEEWVESTEPDRKLVVFAHHRHIVKSLAERFGAGMIQGGIPHHVRDETIERFVEDDEPRILVCSIGAAGVGLNFQRASDIIFAEQPWTPADCIQAEDRCHRMGQTRGVIAEYVVAAGTIDEQVARTIERKREIAGEAIDGTDNWDDQMTQAVAVWLKERKGELPIAA